jgi:hypothetical protein
MPHVAAGSSLGGLRRLCNNYIQFVMFIRCSTIKIIDLQLKRYQNKKYILLATISASSLSARGQHLPPPRAQKTSRDEYYASLLAGMQNNNGRKPVVKALTISLSPPLTRFTMPISQPGPVFRPHQVLNLASKTVPISTTNYRLDYEKKNHSILDTTYYYPVIYDYCYAC